MTTEKTYLTPEKTMQIVLDIIKEIIPYELAVILSKEGHDLLKVRYFNGVLSTEGLNNYQISLRKRLDILEVLNVGKVKLVEDTNDLSHIDTYDEVIDLPLGHSCMLIPLKNETETIGLLTLDHRECDIFTPQKTQFAQMLSRLISLALSQSIFNETLNNINETLIFERTSLINNLSDLSRNLIGNSKVWINVLNQIKICAPTNSPIMILGETGTGKEEIAKAIHSLSDRNNKPFIALNCSALNVNLAESELFGHEKGAFTGAVSTRKGRFELADGGTLFLDEIGDLPLEIQPKLLRALQNSTFERVGSEKTITTNVRIICATNANLENKITAGEFREDLFYRLNVFPIIIPPLRKRTEDIVLLVKHFINKFAKFQKSGISKEAITILENYNWPGNIRELQNVIERALILSNNNVIQPEHLILNYSHVSEEKRVTIVDDNIDSLDNEIKKVIQKALKLCNGKIYGADGAANLLNIKPTTLQSKIKKLNIKHS